MRNFILQRAENIQRGDLAFLAAAVGHRHGVAEVGVIIRVDLICNLAEIAGVQLGNDNAGCAFDY